MMNIWSICQLFPEVQAWKLVSAMYEWSQKSTRAYTDA